MRYLWAEELKSDKRKLDEKFVKVNSIQQLRRLLAGELYGTKTYLHKGTWEAPICQSIID